MHAPLRFAFLIAPVPSIPHTTGGPGVNRATPEIVESTDGCNVNVICPLVAGVPDRSLTVPEMVVVVAAKATEDNKNKIAIIIFNVFSNKNGHPKVTVIHA